QAETVPLPCIASVTPPPEANAVTPVSRVGTNECASLLLPAHSPPPAPHTVPSPRNIWLDRIPAAIALASEMPVTFQGPAPIVRLPSWPRSLPPQTQTLPSLASARACHCPAEMATMPDKPGMGLGRFCGALVRWPNCSVK